MEDNEEEEDPMFPEFGDTAMEDNAEERGDQERASDKPDDDQERALDESDDDLGRDIVDAREDCESELERLKLDGMLQIGRAHV